MNSEKLHNPQKSADPADVADASPERIAEVADQIVARMQQSSGVIAKINSQTRMLSLNAQIEAARAGGTTGAAFGVVASAIRDLSDQTARVSEDLTRETGRANESMQGIIRTLATNVRGTRLSDLALTNIDLIDRNLYERSCDVRWWATDSSGVEALTRKTPEAYQHCSRRFGVILNSYTVYHDLVLCDLEGRVVANGRPSQYRSAGMSCASDAWFAGALATRTGEEFGFQSVHASPLVNDQRVLAYSCCVREGGSVTGKPLGVLGILFHWDALAQTIVHETPLAPDEKQRTRVCIVDDSGLVLADTQDRQLQETLRLPGWERLRSLGKGFVTAAVEGRECCLGHARSPGYETYATGWHSLLIQKV